MSAAQPPARQGTAPARQGAAPARQGAAPASPRAQARRAASLPGPALLAECDEEFFTAGGPGGQHRNKTESGVRLLHRPTGVTAAATERRSQAQNRGEALRRLRDRLAAMGLEPKVRRPTRPTRASRERRLGEKRRRAARKAGRRVED